MKSLYFIAAVIGSVIPMFFFFQFIQLSGFNLPVFFAALFANGAAGGISADLLISSFVFWVFMIQQHKANNSPKPWLFIALNLSIGLACALPAYFYMVEKSRNK
jgi:Terpene cyclase DEP1